MKYLEILKHISNEREINVTDIYLQMTYKGNRYYNNNIKAILRCIIQKNEKVVNRSQNKIRYAF